MKREPKQRGLKLNEFANFFNFCPGSESFENVHWIRGNVLLSLWEIP